MDSFTDWTPNILAHYRTLKYAPPHGCFTILAAMYLVDESSTNMKIISMATGSKCLPTARFSHRGDTVHDFHAEVLARRGAVRWLLCEMTRNESEWLQHDELEDVWTLRDGVTVNMYVSELPCKM